MRNLLMLCLCLAVAGADKIAVQTIGCKSERTFESLDDKLLGDSIALQQFANKHGCVVLSSVDKIEVVANATESQSLYVQVIVNNTQERYIVPRRAVMIEQPGTKNRFSF